MIHQLDGDAVVPMTEPPPVSTRRRVLTVTGILVFAVVAGIALAYGLGARLPGQTITGNQSAASAQASAEAQLARLRAAVKARPDDVAAHLALAQALMGTQDGGGRADAVPDRGPARSQRIPNPSRTAGG